MNIGRTNPKRQTPLGLLRSRLLRDKKTKQGDLKRLDQLGARTGEEAVELATEERVALSESAEGMESLGRAYGMLGISGLLLSLAAPAIPLLAIAGVAIAVGGGAAGMISSGGSIVERVREHRAGKFENKLRHHLQTPSRAELDALPPPRVPPAPDSKKFPPPPPPSARRLPPPPAPRPLPPPPAPDAKRLPPPTYVAAPPTWEPPSTAPKVLSTIYEF